MGGAGQHPPETTNVAFELKSLLIGGQCFDVRDRRPPNGLQLELQSVLPSIAAAAATGSASSSASTAEGGGAASNNGTTTTTTSPPPAMTHHLKSKTDTLVMQNLGYFQLKAAPGVFSLQLAPGRARDLFELAADATTRAASQVQPVVVADFDATIEQFRVRKVWVEMR